MSEELKEEVAVVEEGKEQVEEKVIESSEPEFTDVELRAMKMGWKPKDEFQDEDDFVDADEFIKRKPLFDKNAQLKSELKDVKKALRELASFQTKIREDERKRVTAELRERKRQALTEGDVEKLIEIDEEIADVRAAEIAEKNVPPVRKQPHPQFVAWVERNPWYAQDGEMRAEADLVGTAYAASNPDKDPIEVLKYVESRMKRAFPEKFKNPNRERPSTVEGTSKQSSKQSSSSKEDSFELNEEEQRAMKSFVRAGVMTKDEYIKELKKVRGVA